MVKILWGSIVAVNINLSRFDTAYDNQLIEMSVLNTAKTEVFTTAKGVTDKDGELILAFDSSLPHVSDYILRCEWTNNIDILRLDTRFSVVGVL